MSGPFSFVRDSPQTSGLQCLSSPRGNERVCYTDNMSWVYHAVPKSMKGDFLLPLNSLRTSFPELYFAALRKYQEREHVPNQRIDGLDCRWVDVVHLSPVAPNDLMRALGRFGFGNSTTEFFQIDANSLDPTRTIIYLNKDLGASLKTARENFRPFDPANLKRYSSVTREALVYYRRQAQLGRKPLWFHGIPHILHRGPIFIGDSARLRPRPVR